MNRRRVAFVTGTRAEYGLLSLLMDRIKNEPEFELQLIVTGMHLSPEFGVTFREIEKDGFIINDKVEMLLSSDTPVGIAKSIGLGVIGFADVFDRLKPELVVLLGDRFEIMAAAQAAHVARIPIAHIAGGDTTEGAIDEAFRHAVTKMSHIHFVTNEDSARRVRLLGENPEYIFNVGSPSLDLIRRLNFISRGQLEQDLGFVFREKNLLITFHPVTIEVGKTAEQCEALLTALDGECPLTGLIFTMPNADTEGRAIVRMINDFVVTRSNAAAFTSLGYQRYLSVMKLVDAVVGNSSSGLYEAPALKKPTINIGDRQRGRLKATSVIDCAPEAEAIRESLVKARIMDCSSVVSPYGTGTATEQMFSIIRELHNPSDLLKKRFFESVL
jgi:UDP-hydrolysing UDP-N-acetyl-D-glucosamine 2-epimerase